VHIKKSPESEGRKVGHGWSLPGIVLERAAALPHKAAIGALVVVLAVIFAPATTVLSGSQSNDGVSVAFLPAATTRPAPQLRRELKIRQGDTLMKLITKAGIPRAQAHAAISALRPVYDPRSIMPGQSVTVTYSKDGGVTLQSLDLSPSFTRKVLIERDGGAGFTATERKAKLLPRLVRVTGVIQNSLYRAGSRAGLPPRVLAGMMQIFSWDVDFQRDIQPGDKFDVAFKRFYTADGVAVQDGEILYAAMTLSGTHRALYRYEYEPKRYGYFDKKGKSARKALLRTPVDGARLASRYGRRRHPVLGYTRMHRGVDFAAARGTPIYAAGDGTIAFRGRNGAYGRFIRVRHNGTYSTAYAHLKGYAKRLRRGSRVRQGQVIGYVGTSGLSTGPHLHFEVMKKGRQINPLRLRMPSGKTLKGSKMVAFQKLRGATKKTIAALAQTSVKVSNR
jgi:murein DD-endopeptidase MepM/ murein hydrolase activator NlpD